MLLKWCNKSEVRFWLVASQLRELGRRRTAIRGKSRKKETRKRMKRRDLDRTDMKKLVSSSSARP